MTAGAVVVDGRRYPVRNGRNFLELCQDNGIELPHLCNRKGLSVEATCGLCFVEQRILEKWVPVLACVLVPREGMEIRTKSENIAALRRLSARNLLRIHRVQCGDCRALGHCFLQKIYRQFPCGLTLELAPEERYEPPAPLGESALCIDRRKCIGCGLCVRHVQEVLGEDWLSIETLPHGFRRIDVYPGIRIPPEYNAPLIELCPVQALSDRRRRPIRVYDALKIDHGVAANSSRSSPEDELWRRHQWIRASPKRDDIPLELREWEARKELTGRALQGEDRLLQPLVHGEPTEASSALLRILSVLTASRRLGIVLGDGLCLEDLLLLSRWCSHRKPGKLFFFPNFPPERRYPPPLAMDPRVLATLGLGDARQLAEGLPELNRAIETGELDALWIFGDLLQRGLGKKRLCAVPVLCMGPRLTPTSELCDFVLPTPLFSERSGWILGRDGMLRTFAAEKESPEGVREEWRWTAMLINLYGDYGEGQQRFLTRAALWSELQIHYPALGSFTCDALPAEGIRVGERTGPAEGE